LAGEAARRALIIVENLPVPFDRRVWLEATTLREAGWEVEVICPVGPGHPEREETLDGIRIHRHPLPPEGEAALGYFREYAHALRWERRLARAAWRERPFDVVHICNPPDLLFLVARPFRRKGAALIFDQHDINPELYEAKYGRRDAFHRALLMAEKATYKAADVVIATNESYKQIAMERGGKAAEDVFVVRSGPRLDRFRPVPADPKWRRGRRFVVGYVGVIGEQEGIDHLLKAARILRGQGRDDIHFMLVGGGPAVERLKGVAKDLGVDDVVEFAGRVPDAELISRLCTADVCVNPDTANPFNDKSTMNKIMEYMALGRPIVQFDLTEGRRSALDASLYARHNDAAHLAELIAKLLDDPGARERMGAFGQKRMREELEWTYQKPKLLAAYERALEKRNARS
jgi:glycosyltransferase involved in cell wall biosynthesis